MPLQFLGKDGDNAFPSALFHINDTPLVCVNEGSNIVVSPEPGGFVNGEPHYPLQVLTAHGLVHPVGEDGGQGLFVAAEDFRCLCPRHVGKDEHGVPLKQQGKPAILPLKRRAYLLCAAMRTPHPGPLAMDEGRIEQTVPMPPNTLCWLIAIAYSGTSARRAGKLCALPDIDIDVDFFLLR